MLRVCAVIPPPRFLQTTHRLSLLVLALVLSVLILLALMEHAKREQIKLSSTIHASFNELQPVDVTFEKTSAPGQRQSGKYRVFIFLYAGDKRFKDCEMTGCYFRQPSIKLFSCALAHHVQKRFHQLVGGFKLWAGLPQLSEVLLLLFLQLLWSAEKEPGGLWCGEGQKGMRLDGNRPAGS